MNKTASTKTASTKTVSVNVSSLVGIPSTQPEKSAIRFSVTSQEMSSCLYVDLAAKADDRLSNAQKAFQLASWVRLAMVSKAVPSLLTTIESALLSLPAGDTVIKVCSAKTGEVSEKKRNNRDIAKTSIKTAWKTAAKDCKDWNNTEVSFKLNTPEIKPVVGKVKAALQDKVLNLLGDKIDKAGLSAIMLVIEVECQRVADLIKTGEQERANVRLDDAIRENYRNLLTLGVDSSKAVSRTAAYMDVDTSRVESAIAK